MWQEPGYVHTHTELLNPEPPRVSRRARLREDRHAGWGRLTVMISLLELGRRDVAERLEQAVVVVPGDPRRASRTRRPRRPATVRDDGSPPS